MVEFPKALEHQDAEKKDDPLLRQESQNYLAKTPALQVIAELVETLRKLSPPWWTPETLRAALGVKKRMAWYRQRADLRQAATTAITGLAPKIARKKTPDFQAALIDSALDDGDVSCTVFEDAFDTRDIAVYGAAEELWQLFRRRMPWDQSTPANQELIGNLLAVLLADKSALVGASRKPILTAWDVRTSIDNVVWHTRIPMEIRAAIDDARFTKEKTTSRDAFHAVHDLAIATPGVIAKYIPLKNLETIFETAEKRMGISAATAAAAPEPEVLEPSPASVGPKSRRNSSPPQANVQAIPSAAPAAKEAGTATVKAETRPSLVKPTLINPASEVVVDLDAPPDSQAETGRFELT